MVTSLYCEEKPFNFAGTFDLVAWERPGETFTLRGRAQDQLVLPGLFKIDVRNLIDRVLKACGGLSGQVVVKSARELLVRVDEPRPTADVRGTPAVRRESYNRSGNRRSGPLSSLRWRKGPSRRGWEK